MTCRGFRSSLLLMKIPTKRPSSRRSPPSSLAAGFLPYRAFDQATAGR